MPRHVLIEELHIFVQAPMGLWEKEYLAMRRCLYSTSLQQALRNGIVGTCRRYSSLKKAKITLSR